MELNDFYAKRSDREKMICEYRTKQRPHVVLLGAGASCAAIPYGDKNARKISAMDGFCETIGISKNINKYGLHTKSKNLEDIYMEVHERAKTDTKFIELESSIENDIRAYLNEFILPDAPTVYDFLILALREKDVIATFNWDPLIVQAYARAASITSRLPKLLFLHGNVAVKYAGSGPRTRIYMDQCDAMPKDAKILPLLYPIANKEYSKNTAINNQWEQLRYYMQRAYRFSIFGYSAPRSDQEAIAMLQSAWGHADNRNFEQTEIIDIKTDEELHSTWESFICSHHYDIVNCFFKSSISMFPRRTCETLFDTKMNLLFSKGTNLGFQPNMTFKEIEGLLSPLLNDEENTEYKPLEDPYVENANC